MVFVESNTLGAAEGIVGGLLKKSLAVGATDMVLGSWISNSNGEVVRRLKQGFGLYCAVELVEEFTTGTSNFRTVLQSPEAGLVNVADDTVFYGVSAYVADTVGLSEGVYNLANNNGLNPDVSGYVAMATVLEGAKLVENSLGGSDWFRRVRRSVSSML